MAFWNSKKKGNHPVRSLTEKEIQSKLYGKYVSGASPSAAPTSHNLNESYQRLRFSNPVVTTATSNVDTLVQPREEEKSKPDAFKTPKPVSETVEKAFAPAVSASSKYSASEMKGVVPPVRKQSGALSLVRAAGSFFWSCVASCAAVIFRATQWLSSGKTQSRRFLYWAGCILFLFSLLGGIHYLNTKREEAMSRPKPKKMQTTAQQTAQRAISAPAQAPVEVEPKLESVAGVTVAIYPTAQPAKPASQPAAVAPKEAQAPAISEGRFVIQVATFASEGDAQRLVDQFKNSKFPAFAKDLRNSSGKVYHSVFIGRFQEFRDAQKSLEEFRKQTLGQPFEDAFIRTLQ